MNTEQYSTAKSETIEHVLVILLFDVMRVFIHENSFL